MVNQLEKDGIRRTQKCNEYNQQRNGDQKTGNSQRNLSHGFAFGLLGIGRKVRKRIGQRPDSLAQINDDGTEIFPDIPGPVIIKLMDSKDCA